MIVWDWWDYYHDAEKQRDVKAVVLRTAQGFFEVREEQNGDLCVRAIEPADHVNQRTTLVVKPSAANTIYVGFESSSEQKKAILAEVKKAGEKKKAKKKKAKKK